MNLHRFFVAIFTVAILFLAVCMGLDIALGLISLQSVISFVALFVIAVVGLMSMDLRDPFHGRGTNLMLVCFIIMMGITIYFHPVTIMMALVP